MQKQYIRSAALFGDGGMEKLFGATVAVFGIGGVGSYTVEALARAGVGHLILVDADTVDESNINRQIIALHSTVGRDKVEVARERIADIDPSIRVTTYKLFVTPENLSEIDLTGVNYIVDAIDSVPAKLALAQHAHQVGTPLISCMGTGNKLDPSKLTVADISKTSVCPLARSMRTKLKKLGIAHLKVVFSTEIPVETEGEICEQNGQTRRAPASCSFVPSSAGLLIASEIIREILGIL